MCLNKDYYYNYIKRTVKLITQLFIIIIIMYKICIHSIVTGMLIFSKIAQFSSHGGRLICIEMTGYQQTQGLSAAMGGVGAGNCLLIHRYGRVV